jgi:hypothetical protein
MTTERFMRALNQAVAAVPGAYRRTGEAANARKKVC